MPTGRVKVFRSDKEYGFVVPDEGGRDVYVNAAEVAGRTLRSGDLVEFELDEGERSARARNVKVVRAAPEGNPVGRTLSPPPTWSELEDRERQARQARRRRR